MHSIEPKENLMSWNEFLYLTYLTIYGPTSMSEPRINRQTVVFVFLGAKFTENCFLVILLHKMTETTVVLLFCFGLDNSPDHFDLVCCLSSSFPALDEIEVGELQTC